MFMDLLLFRLVRLGFSVDAGPLALRDLWRIR